MRRILSIFLLAILLVMVVMPVSADSGSKPVLYMAEEDAPIPGATFEIYRVGEALANGKLALTDDFSLYPVDPNTPGEDTSPQASILYSYAKMDGITPVDTTETNEKGFAATKTLSDGLYLIAGQPFRYNGYIYYTEPQLILLPQRDKDDGEIIEEPVLSVKFSRETAGDEPISRKVLKIWKDNNSNKRPSSLTVHLLKDGKVYDSVILRASNQWRYVWENLDSDAHWQIIEDVPAGYTVTLEQEGLTFLLTNTAPELPPSETTPTTPSGGKIDQTGMIWWPVILLGALGMLFIFIGILLRKEPSYDA